LPELRVLDAPVALLAPRPVVVRRDPTGGVYERIRSQNGYDIGSITTRKRQSFEGHEDFVRSLNIKIDVSIIRNPADNKFNRCFELINKTNQFNTTGRRWTPAEMINLLNDGGYLVSFDVEDRYTRYGVVGVAVIKNELIEQFVMSCRVLGLEIELAAISKAVGLIADAGYLKVNAKLISTGRNSLCLELYRDVGFSDRGDGNWEIGVNQGISIPSHVELREELQPV
jgi:FkbH-like protein